MNIKQLIYFCKIVEAGSASQASKILDIAPGTLSMQLASLENELGGELLDRSSRPMTLTIFGQFFYPRAQELIYDFENLETDTHHFISGKSTSLTIAFTRSVMFNLLPETIKCFTQKWGHISIHLRELISEHQSEMLLNQDIDIGITREFDDDNFIANDLNHQLILSDPLMAVIPRDHYLARKQYLTLRDFCHAPFISYPSDQRFSQKVFEKFKEHNCSPVISQHTREIHTALALVGAGLGVTLVGKTTMPNNRQDILFLPIQDFRLTNNIYAVSNPRNKNPNIPMFIENLLQMGI